jgi:hypothetical protein
MKSRVLYEVDPHNRLIIKRTGARSTLKRFRKVVYGRFRTDNKNRLYYEVFKSSGTAVPQKIEFSGRYSLDETHNLIYKLNKWGNQCEGNRLRLRTKIIDTNGNEIVFLSSSRLSEGKRSIDTMRLHGLWQVDGNNRLRFGVKRENKKSDILTLFKAWKINNNEIEYMYNRNEKALRFKGSWDIKKRYRLGYILEGTITSGFNFRSSLGQIIPKGKKIYVKFDIAIDIPKRKRLKRKIIFRCRFKMRRAKEVILEVSPHKRGVSLRLKKEILNKRGLSYIESFFRDRERYFGGGLVLRW